MSSRDHSPGLRWRCMAPFLVVLGVSLAPHADATWGYEPPTGSLWHYRGRLTRLGAGFPESTNGTRSGMGAGGKSFDWYVLVGGENADRSARFIVEEEGYGGWDWTRAFGKVAPQQPSTAEGDGGTIRAALRYDHAMGRYRVALLTWRWVTDGWKPGRTWQSPDKQLRYTVSRSAQFDGRPVWIVTADSAVGRKRTLWIGQDDGVLRRLDETVFMGRGEKYRLALRLVKMEVLEGGTVRRAIEQLDQLAELRRRLGLRQDAGSVPWTAAQLKVLRNALPAEPDDDAWPPLKRLVERVRRDASEQTRQAGALADLASRAVGKEMAQWTLSDADGRPVALSDLGPGVTILHFWEYRHTPLRPPYGQVGLLDFLQRKRQRSGVRVVGVAVHPGGPSEAERRAVVRSVKKLTRFMNLSYPVLYDDGSVLAQLGDPRRLGVSLPLFIVLDREHRVRAYHAGYYRVDPKDGLKELEGVIDRVGKAAAKP